MAIDPARFGTLGVGDAGDFRIQFDRTLHHPIQTVWQALTVPEKFAVWMPGCSIEPRVGGVIRYDFEDEGVATGTVTAIEPPGETGLLAHSWRWEGVPESSVTWQLIPDGTGTRLTLVHRELGRDAAADFAIGWHAIIDTLERYSAGESWDDVWDQHEELAAVYADRAVADPTD